MLIPIRSYVDESKHTVLCSSSGLMENTDYLDISEVGLQGIVKIANGKGEPWNPIKTRVRISNCNTITWTGIVHIEISFPAASPRFFLPAFMYGRNRGETPQNVHCKYPRLRDDTPTFPSSSWWMVRGDRLSHPIALVYDSGKIYGLSASPYLVCSNGVKHQWIPDEKGEFYQYNGYSCSISKGTIGYTLGYENAPFLFVNSQIIKERVPLSDNCITLEPGEVIDVVLDLYEYDSESELGVNEAIEEVYYRYHQSPRSGSNKKTTVSDLAQAICQDAWLPDYFSYAGQVFNENGRYRYNKIFSISWTNGLSVATPMLIASLRLEDERMRAQALSCITYIIQNSLNPSSGLLYDAYNDGNWSVKGWWFDGLFTAGHSSYLSGQAIFYILKAYEYEKKLKNCVHDDWIEFCEKVIMKLEQAKNSDNEYPYIISESTGAGIEYNSFGGVWCLAALSYYCWITCNNSYLKSMRKSEAHYYISYIKHMECYGAPLDTCKTIDSEGILAYIKAVKYLHMLTDDVVYLEHMRDAFCYEFSFKFCYNSPIQIPPLSKIGWSSCGGSVTSVSNPHIHPMSNIVIDEMLYFIKQCNDDYIHDRMMDTIGWGCQTYNTYDNEYDFGKKGWMSERFCYSEGLVKERYSDGSYASTWFCLMPWAAGSIIDGLTGDLWEMEEK